jgi:FixJ family two-component response regulator
MIGVYMEALHIIDDDVDLLFAWKLLFEKEGYRAYPYP